MKRKKILFFIYQLGDGGAARTILNIANHLDQTTFEPIIVTLNYKGNYEHYLHADIPLVKLNTKRLRSAIFPLAKLIRHEKPHIVFSTIPNYSTIAILAKLLSFTKTKIIVREAAYLGGNLKENTSLLIYGLLYRFASRVVALSNGVKKNLQMRYKVNPHKIHVIYNPIDLDKINDQMNTGKIAEEHEQLFQTNRKVIITAGRLVKEKDQQTLIKAFAKVRKQIDSDLIILGEGPLKKTLQQLAEELDISAHVHFLGFLENPYIYFNRSDVFVLSSISEGFGHVLVEALATKTLVVSTDCKPGSDEVLNNGEYGMICQVGHAQEMAEKIIQSLQASKEEKAARITHGYARANEFSARAIVEQYEDVFTNVIDANEKTRQRGDD